MNVIIANDKQNDLASLDIDIIKSLNGSYNASEIVEMFKSFFYSKMILDVTALKDYDHLEPYEVLAKGLDPNKIIFLLPEGSKLCTPNFLSKLISLNIYNFTTNLNGIKYLLKKANTLKDVEHIQKMAKEKENNFISNNETTTSKDSNDKKNIIDSGNNITTTTNTSNNASGNGPIIIGFKNVTEHSGATTLIYMLKKELVSIHGSDNVIAIEIDKSDFQLFNEKNMISVKNTELRSVIQKYSQANVILVDINDCSDTSFCKDVIYLMEPSTIILKKLVRKNKAVFSSLLNKKVVLNKSMLLNNDVFDIEGEAGIKVFYNISPLDERKKNAVLVDFLTRLGLMGQNNTNNSNKIFGLFRR